MMKKAMASDFDNTLHFMFLDEPYRKGDREAIRAFQQAGGLFGVSTGRSLRGVRQAAREDVRFDFYILATGALVLDGNLQVLMKKTVSRDCVEEIYDRYGRRADTVIQANDTVYTLTPPKFPGQTRIMSFADLAGSDIYGISFYAGSDEAAQSIARDIQQEYGTTLTAYANTSVVDVVGSDCSKGTGLAAVKEKLAIHTMGAIGDSYNDTPMLKAADISFTFSYAPEPVQQAAGHIVSSVREALSYL